MLRDQFAHPESPHATPLRFARLLPTARLLLNGLLRASPEIGHAEHGAGRLDGTQPIHVA
jgi:hypothetical protein